MSPELTSKEQERYSRHILLPEVGRQGQAQLKAAKVLVVGAGGLGSPVSLYLAAAGVGKLGIVDQDVIDITNLQRQILHDSNSIGISKTVSAYARLHALNPEIEIVEYPYRLTADNAIKIVSEYDLVVDGSDNFSTRYLLNDCCVLSKKPLVHGAIYRFEGQASVFAVPGGPCYRCLFPQEPQADAVPNCAEAGVLGALAGVIGSIQAVEALKLILSLGNTLVGRLLVFDALELEFNILSIAKDPACPACGTNPLITSIRDNQSYRDLCDSGLEIDTQELAQALKQALSLVLVDVRNNEELQFGKIANSINISLSDLESKLAFGEDLGFSKGDELVMYCKSGMRSQRAAQMLRQKGYEKVRSLKGGIMAWAKEIDHSITIY
jgi:adenylyltransferase/sulfurtransferase